MSAKSELIKVAVVGCGCSGKNLVRSFSHLGALAAEYAGRKTRGLDDVGCPVSEQSSSGTLAISLYPEMSSDQMQAQSVATAMEHVTRHSARNGET